MPSWRAWSGQPELQGYPAGFLPGGGTDLPQDGPMRRKIRARLKP